MKVKRTYFFGKHLIWHKHTGTADGWNTADVDMKHYISNGCSPEDFLPATANELALIQRCQWMHNDIRQTESAGAVYRMLLPTGPCQCHSDYRTSTKHKMESMQNLSQEHSDWWKRTWLGDFGCGGCQERKMIVNNKKNKQCEWLTGH